MFSRILVAMDDSEAGDRVFEKALALTKLTNARLMLMHVLSSVEVECDSSYQDNIPSPKKQSAEALEALKHQYLQKLRTRVSAVTDLGTNADLGLLSGNIGQQICENACRWGADLILMGHRGLSALEEETLGSVSNYVLHHAPCSLLVIHQGESWKTPVNQSLQFTAVG
jgi:nucleotide-binding universal stress UspA family protein